jgi:hypothetical protein
MNENPETVPQSESINMGVTADIRLTSTAEQLLFQTRPWAVFMSVMMFIGAGFMVIIGMIISAMGIGLRAIPSGPGRFGAMGFGINILLGVFYMVSGVLYIAPGVFLWRFASAIQNLEAARSPQALENALRNQKSFWCYAGILTIVFLAIGVLFVAFAIIAALFATRRNF